MLFPPYLHSHEVERLQLYKYTSSKPTPLDALLNPFWNAAAAAVPKWLSPNTLTVLGLLSSGFGAALCLVYAPTLTEDTPTWVWPVVALTVFVYQTLDAIDGKHARRTGASSPLGQLVDHGCDAFTACFMGIVCCAAAKFGASMNTFAILMCLQTNTFVWNWLELHTDRYTTSFGIFGVTEGQYTVIVACLMPLVLGDTDLVAMAPLAARPYLSQLGGVLGTGGAFYWHTFLGPCWCTIDVLLVAATVVEVLRKAKDRLQAAGHLFWWLVYVYASYVFFTRGGASFHVGWFCVVSTVHFAIYFLRALASTTCKVLFAQIQWPLLPFFATTVLLSAGPPSALLHQLGMPRDQFIFTLMTGLTAWGVVYLGELIVANVRTICRVVEVPFWRIPAKTPKERKRR
ncbi:unnamed protein product [Vitrella brassicaformis CCMP3155]|uniref:Ethanolaminephosphotransferase n=1 Tax=Vitrella brassicaformis (strain CCMP3155) TaxID=1169540 RepID=A0A0G4FX88_VITBC|nr:unnamed protein product [Vitrella brassicaformis CCMP3155]|eukprot:CEM19462.1 unnamed protein product [Vitrella brassicaformis CCMP3155]